MLMGKDNKMIQTEKLKTIAQAKKLKNDSFHHVCEPMMNICLNIT